MGNPPKSAQQVLQDTIQNTYAQKVKEQADTLPHQVLGQMLNAWAANGGGQSPNGASSTDLQGHLNQNMSPEITANSAQSISPGQQDNNGFFGGGRGDPNSGSTDGQPTVGPNKMALLGTLVGMANPSNNDSIDNSDTTDTTTKALSTPGDPIQESALKIATQKPGLLMSIFKGIFNSNNEAQLNNLKTAQEITQGGTPLSPADKATAIGNYNKALIDQHNEVQKSITDQITSTSTAIDQLVKNTPLGNKVYGSPYYETLANLQARLQELTNKGTEAVQNFTKLQITNPIAKSSNSGIQQFNVGGITYNIPANRVAAFKKAKGL